MPIHSSLRDIKMDSDGRELAILSLQLIYISNEIHPSQDICFLTNFAAYTNSKPVSVILKHGQQYSENLSACFRVAES